MLQSCDTSGLDPSYCCVCCVQDEVNLADMNTKSVLLHEMIHAYLMTHKDGDVRRSQDEFEHPSAFTAKCAEILSKSNEQTGGVFDDGQVRVCDCKATCKGYIASCCWKCGMPAAACEHVPEWKN